MNHRKAGVFLKKVFIVPHTHFDAEVFLTREETLSWGFSNLLDALALLERDPEFKFTLEQVCYIEPFMERYPECRDTFLRHIRDGRLEIVCGMYAMADMNIPSGESLSRQFMRGINYCRNELGVDISIGWPIDSFGLSPQTPQILSRCGLNYLVFSRVADPEFSEFIWVAPDGSEVLCHWMPMHYGGIGSAPTQEEFNRNLINRIEIISKWSVSEVCLILEGADLSSPDPVYQERVRRFAIEHPDYDVKIAVPSEFFAEVEKYRNQLEKVTADFNPLFQGCYSSRIEVKQGNSRLQDALVTAELLDAVTGLGTERAAFDRLWDPVLFNQFHDDICGCHTDKVFRLIMERYLVSGEGAGAIIGAALKKLEQSVGTHCGEGEIPILVFNPLGWERKDMVTVKLGFSRTDVLDLAVRDGNGKPIPCELRDVKRHDTGIRDADVSFVADVPSAGCSVFYITPLTAYTPRIMQAARQYHIRELKTVYMENEQFKMEVDFFTGVIKSLVLKQTGEELIDPQMPWGAMIVKESDCGDFWELNAPLRGGNNNYLDRSRSIFDDKQALCSKDSGGQCEWPLETDIRQVFSFSRGFGKGKFKYTITVYRETDRIDIEGEIVNYDEDVRYRAAFPLNLANDKSVIRGIPYGCTTQPDGEYPAVDFCDVSDGKKGLSLLNIGLPGNDVHDGILSLSLFRAVSYKGYSGGGFDESSIASGGFEIGKSIPFKYALYPHNGECDTASSLRAARELNVPLIAVKCAPHPGILPQRHSFLAIPNENVILSCFMESGSGKVLRVYEAGGRPAAVDASIPGGYASACDVDMTLKRLPDRKDLTLNGEKLRFNLGAYEVRTILLE